MSRISKRLIKSLRRNNIVVVDDSVISSRARFWGKRKASEHLYAYSHDNKEYHKKALKSSIEAMKNYGNNFTIKKTKRGKELTDNDRKFFRIASNNMNHTLAYYERTGRIPAYTDMITKDYKKSLKNKK